MPAQNYSSVSGLARGQTPRRVVDPTSRPRDFFNLLMMRGRFVPMAEPYTHALVTSGNSTAARHTEEQALPDGARRTTVNVVLNAFYWWEAVRLTGRVRDINALRGFVEDDLLRAEQEGATLNVLTACDQDLLGSTANLGLISIIDDSDSYGGISPGTYSAHASYVSTSVGTLTAAKLEDHWEASKTAPYACRPTDILVAPNQDTNYGRIMGPSANATNLVPAQMAIPAQSAYDIGIAQLPKSFNGVPLRPIQGLSTTDILFPDFNDLTFALQKDLGYTPLGARNADVEGFVEMGGALIVENRRAHSKMEGVTA